MKKIFTLGIFLLLILTFFCACKNENATLKNMKKALQSAGYTIVENYSELYGFHEDKIQSVNGFSFVFSGVHENINIPVLEFQDNVSAEAYAELVKSSGYDFLAIVNGNFLIVLEAHNGVVHDDEKIFFESLINGKSIK